MFGSVKSYFYLYIVNQKENTMEKKIGKYLIKVINDDDPFDPRGDDNLGTMVCFHPRHNLGDKHNFNDGYDFNEYWKSNKKKIGVILPLYLYDHSGITMNTTGFSCPWDSGKVGYIFITKEKMREEYGYKRVSKKLIKRVTEYLKSEVETYDDYLTGNMYGFTIEDTETGEEVENSFGYCGEENCLKEAESMVKYMMKSDEHGQLELKLE